MQSCKQLLIAHNKNKNYSMKNIFYDTNTTKQNSPCAQVPTKTRVSSLFNSMASTPFSTFCHFHKPTLLFLASDGFRLGGAPAIAFGKVRKNRKMGIFPVCRAGSAVVFRDLDADDFRHPLDQQVRPISPFFLPFWIDFSINTYMREKKMN